MKDPLPGSTYPNALEGSTKSSAKRPMTGTYRLNFSAIRPLHRTKATFPSPENNIGGKFTEYHEVSDKPRGTKVWALVSIGRLPVFARLKRLSPL